MIAHDIFAPLCGVLLAWGSMLLFDRWRQRVGIMFLALSAMIFVGLIAQHIKP